MADSAAPLWTTAFRKLSALSALGRPAARGAGAPVDTAAAPEAAGGTGPGATAVQMAPSRGAAARRCYKIPEDSDGATAAGGGTGSCRWHCPLTAPRDKLPQGAQLKDNVLDMGATPCMYQCKLGCPAKLRAGKRRAGKAPAADAAVVEAPVEVPEAAQTAELRRRGYVDWLGKGLDRISRGQTAAVEAPVEERATHCDMARAVEPVQNALFEGASGGAEPPVR